VDTELKRGRDLGLPLPGTPGAYNAITDVAGVEVGTLTLIAGDGPLIPGRGPVRTGVTAVLPRGRARAAVPCAAGYCSLNGNGEMTGVAWIEESGELQTPITITNTHSCGVTRDATIRWLVSRAIGTGQAWGLPVAAETYDGDLNDINGFHVTAEHAMGALDAARGGPVELGSVGGGTGMICYDFKGGNGSASRVVTIAGERYTVGVFLQANFGARESLASQPLGGVPGGTAVSVTASFGLALLDPEVGVEDSIERADQALLLAKTAGRNRAISWDSSVTTGTRLPRLQIEDATG